MLFPVFLAILIFLFGSKVIYAAENTEKEADRVQEALFEEFDFSKLDQEMKTLFPDEKLSFREILMQLISENGGSTVGTVVQFIKETVFYQFGTNKKILVYMILIAVASFYMGKNRQKPCAFVQRNDFIRNGCRPFVKRHLYQNTPGTGNAQIPYLRIPADAREISDLGAKINRRRICLAQSLV